MPKSRHFLVTAAPAPTFSRILSRPVRCFSDLHSFTALLGSGSSAVYWACRGLRLEPRTRIWMPSLNCGVEVQAAIDAGLDVGFYRLTEDLSVDEADLTRKLQERPGIVFVIHYFGFPQPSIERLAEECQRRQCILIEDCAHALFSKHLGREVGSCAPIAVFSLRKTLPLADGGALKVNEELLRHVRENPFLRPPIGATSHKAMLAHFKDAARGLLHRSLAGAIPRQRIFTTNASFEGARDYLSAMSPFSKRIATTADPAHIVHRRRQNYLALDQALAGVPGYRKLFAGLPEGVCPLYLPIWVDRREELMSAMHRQGVETFRFGATPHPIIGDALRADSRRLRDNILGLPIHDEVSEDEIATVAELLRALLYRHAQRLNDDPGSHRQEVRL